MPRTWLAARGGLAFVLFFLILGRPALASPPIGPTVAAGCPVVVKNGNFEAQGANWTESGAGGKSLITTNYPFRGKYSAELGGDVNSDQSIKQLITLPNASDLHLVFWWKQDTQETAPGAYDDYLTINVYSAGGTLVKQLDQLGVDPGDPVPPPWEQLNYDISAYKGQTVQLEFVAHNNPFSPTWFYVDEVVVPTCRTYLPLIRK